MPRWQWPRGTSDVSLRAAPHGGARLSGVHLSGVHLSGVHLSGVHLSGVHLSGVHLSGGQLSGQRGRTSSERGGPLAVPPLLTSIR
jgi:uncharacterized protein YjbI with pentapeptide repeats